ncbi:uncharacterized protein M421DRAFT_57307, partial [Didymella exigua CBS 183.55]
KTHIQKVATKGEMAFHAMSRIIALLWGLLVRKSQLVYTAVARPIISTGQGGKGIDEAKIRKLVVVQNKCLRRTLGAYKRIPVAAIKKESRTPPLSLYIQVVTL